MRKFSAVITAFLFTLVLTSVFSINRVSAIEDETTIQPSGEVTEINENNNDSNAPENEDEEEQTGTINIFLDEMSEGKAINIEGVKFSLIKVAELKDGEFTLTDAFIDTNINLNDLNTAEETNEVLAKIMNKVEKENIQGKEGTTNQYGALTYDDLEMGVYYIYATDTNEYDYVMPSIVAIPTHDEASDSINGMMYEIEIVPKHSPKEEEILAAIESVKTGDETSLIPFAVAGTLAILTGAAMRLKFRKRNIEN